ncbi:unnamed protein product, partial [marine sediment metagenome]
REKTKIETAKIPVSVFKGNPGLLPEIFTRLNTEGTMLGKYDILSAIWQGITITVDSNDLLVP